jgi:hypothetical protein
MAPGLHHDLPSIMAVAVRARRGAQRLYSAWIWQNERGIALPNRHGFRLPGALPFATGLVAAWLFDLNEDSLYWLRSRQGTRCYFAAVRRNRRITEKCGWQPFLARPFSALTTQDYQRMHPYFITSSQSTISGTKLRWDVWHHRRWVNDPVELASPNRLFAVVKAWFGIELRVDSLAMEIGFRTSSSTGSFIRRRGGPWRRSATTR